MDRDDVMLFGVLVLSLIAIVLFAVLALVFGP